MIGKKIEALIPCDLEDGLTLLQKYASDCAPLAGGTDLVVLLKSGLGRHVKYLLDISHLAELTSLEVECLHVRLGSIITHNAIATSQLLEDIACLRLAAESIGSPQIRNMGTLGGNLANASPAADLYPPLIVLGARATLQSHRSRREVLVEDLPTGPGSTVIQPDEILTDVDFEIPSQPFYSGYLKIGLRNSLAISVASAALVATFANGRFEEVRLACGAVAPTAMRMKGVENLVMGEQPSPELFREAAHVASTECDPISDIRASRRYRRHVTGVIVSRLLAEASRLAGVERGDD